MDFLYRILQDIKKQILIMKAESKIPIAHSLFSLDSLASNLPQSNSLHQHYHSLVDESYPHLCKMLFLQLVMRENFLIYSDRRVELKEAWNSVNKKLGERVGNIYIVDQLSSIQDIMTNKSDYQRLLIYDLTEASNSGLNYLLNHPTDALTITALQSENKQLRPQLTDLFPFVWHYRGESQELELLISNSNTIKPIDKFDRDKFHQSVAQNYSQTLSVKQEQGFLKAYLAQMKGKAEKKGIIIPHSRWKKTIKFLYFIGLTKLEGAFKRMSLTDCLLAPVCLGRTKTELQVLGKLNQEVLLEMIAYFGCSKWNKQLSSHFWLQANVKEYFSSLSEKLRGKVSFFYPCSKYCQTVKLCSEEGSIFYRVTGFDKKLMSDKYFEVDSKRQYRLSVMYRSRSDVIMHFGLACYDQNKHLISPVCRYDNTAVTVKHYDAEETPPKLIVTQNDRENLKNWKGQNSFPFERCIGIYHNGDIDTHLSINNVIFSEKDSYSKIQGKGVYQSISQSAIQLSETGAKMINSIKNSIIDGVTKIANHYEGGTYAIGSTTTGLTEGWQRVQLEYSGQSRVNSGKQLLMGSRFARVVLMVNYNNGFPEFKVNDKQAVVDIREIQWA